jgi:hypothetical protein
MKINTLRNTENLVIGLNTVIQELIHTVTDLTALEIDIQTTQVVEVDNLPSVNTESATRIKEAVKTRREELRNICYYSNTSERQIESNIYSQLWQVFNVKRSQDIDEDLMPIAVNFIKLAFPLHPKKVYSK